MRQNLTRSIYQKLSENAQKAENVFSLEDQQKLSGIVIESVKPHRFSLQSFDVRPLELSLQLTKDLPNEFSSILDQLQSLIGSGGGASLFESVSSRQRNNKFTSEIDQNLNEFLAVFTKYLHRYDFTSTTQPLINIKLKSFINTLDLSINAFLNTFIANIHSTSSADRAPYNPYTLCWINQLIQHDYNDKLIDFMDIRVLNDKLVEIMKFVIQETQKMKHAGAGQKKEMYTAFFRENLRELYLVIGLANKFSQALSFSLAEPEKLISIYEFCFQFLTVCLKQHYIEMLPYAIIFFLKLVRQRRQKAFDTIVKEQSRKVFESTFSMFEKHLAKFSASQIYSFCSNFSQIQYLGFDNLENIDFYEIARKTHKTITALSYTYKPATEPANSQQIFNEQNDSFYTLNNNQETYFGCIRTFYRKLRFITRAIEKVIVRSYQYEEISSLEFNTKSTLIDKRKNRMMSILLQFQDLRNANSGREQISEDHKYELISLENLIIAFFKKSSDKKKLDGSLVTSSSDTFLNTFTSTMVCDLILPKFDLNGFLQQSYMKNQHTIRKKLFQFHLKLIDHIDDPLQRKRALNDLSRGLLMVFQEHEYDYDIMKKIVSKLSLNLKHCSYEEKVSFFLDLIQRFNLKFFLIEREFCEDAKTKKEQKRINIKQTLQILPLIRECLKIFLEKQKFNEVMRSKSGDLAQMTSAAITEFWVYFVINASILSDESFLSESEQEDINMIALLTPNCLDGEQLTLDASRISHLITSNKDTYAKELMKRYKDSFKLGEKQQSHIPLHEILHCLIQEGIMARKIALLKTHMYSVSQFFTPSIYEGFFWYLKEIGLNAKAFHSMEILVKSMSIEYIELFRKIKLASTSIKEEILAKDFSYLLEASCSSDQHISDFSLSLIQEYIKWFPALVFNPNVLMTFSECLTALSQKCSYEYDSKSSVLTGKHLNYGVNMPTDIKKMGGILVVLMGLLSKLILKGHFIDHTFLKVLIQHIVKQEASISSKIDFGYRFLKYQSINFRGERNQILETILACNPFLWLINQEEFETRINNCNLAQYLVDKDLLELNNKVKNGKPPANFRVIIEAIEKRIHDEIELEFQMEDRIEDEKIISAAGQAIKSKSTLESIVDARMKEIANYCFNLNIIDIVCSNSSKTARYILHSPAVKARILPSILAAAPPANPQTGLFQPIKRDVFVQLKEEIANEMKTRVASFRTVMMKKPQLKNIILSQLLDISRIYLSPTLLKYLLYRFIPFMHSLSSSYFDSTLFYTLGELLSYIVDAINNQGNLYIEERESNSDIFEVRKNIFKGVASFEAEEFCSDQYLRIIQSAESNEQCWFSQLPSIVLFYSKRRKSLFKMHRVLLGFLNENMQVHIAKGLKASIIANILCLNFKIDKSIIEFVPLENICLCIKSWIELLQLQKEFRIRFDSPPQAKLESDYYRCLKFGLYHFAKNLTWNADKSGGSKINKIKDKIKLLLTVCKYLHTDKLNEIFAQPQLKIKKKSKKRFRAAQINIAKGHINSDYFIKISQKSTWYKKIETTIGYSDSCVFSLNLYIDKEKEKEKQIRPFFLRKALINLLSDEIDRLRANSYSEFIDKYNVIKNTYSLAGKSISKEEVVGIMDELMKKSPQLTLYIIRRLSHAINNPQVYLDQLVQLVKQNYLDHLNSSHFLELFIEYNKNNEEMMRENLYWRSPHIQVLLKYISQGYESNPELQLFFTKTMKKLQSEQLIFYLPQIYISLGNKAGPIIRQFLIDYSAVSVQFAHQLIWMAKVESKNDEGKKKVKIPPNLKLIESISKNLIDKIQRNMDGNQQEFWNKVNNFFEAVTAISGVLRPQMPKPEKRDIIKKELTKIQVTTDIYMPTNPRYQIASINLDSGAPMQSAAKCPIMVTFNCRKYEGPDRYFSKKILEKAKQARKNELKTIREANMNHLYFSASVVNQLERENDDSESDLQIEDEQSGNQSTIHDLNTPMKIKPFPQSFSSSLSAAQIEVDLGGVVGGSDNIKENGNKYNNKDSLEMSQSNNNFLFFNGDDNSPSKQRESYKNQQFKFTFHQNTNLMEELQKKPGEQYLELDVKKADEIIDEVDNEEENSKQIFKSSNNNNNHHHHHHINGGGRQSLSNQQQQQQNLHHHIHQHSLEPVSCIFKVFDDVRQDQLALQIITLFQGIFEKANLELIVFPYKTISNRTGSGLNIGGIIECVKDAISRDQLGKTNKCSLYSYFINKFGQEDSMNFQVARENFIRSQAAYSVISYILQIKDRHNGNILINDKGHLIHIDFGFIFDISPANNLRFESANFKLTKEMIEIMGGSKASEAFQQYVNLTIKGFLSMRNYFEHIYNTISLMLASSLPCFLKDSMKHLISRFVLEKNDIEAAKYMRGIIYDAYDKFTTRWYDEIQYMQNKIQR